MPDQPATTLPDPAPSSGTHGARYNGPWVRYRSGAVLSPDKAHGVPGVCLRTNGRAARTYGSVAMRHHKKLLSTHLSAWLNDMERKSNDRTARYSHRKTVWPCMILVLLLPLILLSAVVIGSYSLFERVSPEEAARRATLADVPFDAAFGVEFGPLHGSRREFHPCCTAAAVHPWLAFMHVAVPKDRLCVGFPNVSAAHTQRTARAVAAQQWCPFAVASVLHRGFAAGLLRSRPPPMALA